MWLSLAVAPMPQSAGFLGTREEIHEAAAFFLAYVWWRNTQVALIFEPTKCCNLPFESLAMSTVTKELFVVFF